MAVAAGTLAIATLPIHALADPPSVLVGIGAGSPPAARIEHVFGGRPLSVPIVLHGMSSARADLRARLFQLAPGLAVPVGEYVAVASGVDFSAGLRRDLSVDVVVPAVERESRFELAVFLRVQGQDWRRVGGVSLRAYPDDLLNPLKRWAEQRPLRLHDPAGKLERFLTAEGISFLDSNARSFEKSDDPVLTLLVGGGADALALAKRRARRGEAVILFRERLVDFPRLEHTRWPGGSLLIVELELLDRLAVDPQAQKLLLEVVKSARPGESSREEDLWHERQDPE